MIFSIISSVLLVVAIAAFFDLSAEQITTDFMSLITPKDNLREKAKSLRGNKDRHKIYRKLSKIRTALTVTGKSKQFSLICSLSLIFFGVGFFLSLLIKNVYLLPALSIAFALIPFVYTANSLVSYERHTEQELEVALSIITTSYIRSDDIISAVRENIEYIRPPLREVFMAFEGEATAINSNTKKALYSLKEKIDNEVFREWTDVLIQCQDDRTFKDTLLPTVAKLTDIRIVNNELKIMMNGVKNEYWMMVALVIGNIPLLYFLNKDWFHTLIFTNSGKIVLGICGMVILITSVIMLKITKPIKYKR